MKKFNKILEELNAIEIVEFKNYLIKNIVTAISNINDNAKIIEDNINIRVCNKCGCNMCRNGIQKMASKNIFVKTVIIL